MVANRVAAAVPNMILYMGPEYLALDSDAELSLLVIDRVTCEFVFKEKGAFNLSGFDRVAIFGVIGLIRLPAGPYLIVATGRQLKGELFSQQIYRLAGTRVVPIRRSLSGLTEPERKDNATYLEMLESQLSVPNLYFSYGYDLTRCLQWLCNVRDDFAGMSIHERADPRFLWNSYLLSQFSISAELSSFALPLLSGFVSVQRLVIHPAQTIDYAIISRRCIYRQGTRFFSRGINSNGEVSNFVETEQILISGQFKFSFIQIRGSIPVYWTQWPDLRYKPKMNILPQRLNHMIAYRRHMNANQSLYGKQVALNLVNQHGGEKALHVAFAELVDRSELAQVKYVAYDFHKECGQTRWHRLQLLLDDIERDRQSHGYFVRQRNSNVSQQSGVFRTNCIDCLDRTNVVQSLIAKTTLAEQLVRASVLGDIAELEQHSNLITHLRDVWSDNADALSEQYAGTGALKTDFTRTGKRTYLGMLQDGRNSLTRYGLNNFYDGFRQDAIDLFLGNYRVNETNDDRRSPFPSSSSLRQVKVYTLPSVFVLCLAMAIFTLVLTGEYTFATFLYLMLWMSGALLVMAIVFSSHSDFVDEPKLLKRSVDGDVDTPAMHRERPTTQFGPF